MSRVTHFEIHASQPERAIDFYSALFGWKFTQRFPGYWQIDTGRGAEPGIDGGLIPRRGAPAGAGQAVNAFICTVEVAALDATLERALALGATLALPKMPIPGVGWLAYVSDPDANLLGITQPDPSAV
jgi:predicted enzyme related to lactoylglutathione lyase